MLNKVDGKVGFKNEAELEKFVYGHLDELLNLQPIAKQYRVDSDICDILAVDDKKRLSIIELKNVEDRYVVQQLTRYYESLVREKPFADLVNYENVVRLIAIAPSFHNHNFVDKKYARLELEFWSFELAMNKGSKDVSFKLTNVDNNEQKISTIKLGKDDTATPKQEQKKPEIEWSEDPAERWKQYVIVNAPSIQAVDYYLRLNYSSKLGIKTLTAEEVREKSKKYKRACTKEFKIKLQVISEETGIKIQTKTVKLPQNIQIGYLAAWFSQNDEHDAIQVRYGNGSIPVESKKHKAKIQAFISDILSEMGVSRNPDICDGATCVINTQIPIWVLVDARDVINFDDEDILLQFPSLSLTDLANAWEYASEFARDIRSESRDVFEYIHG
jgi:uncharacterized protein (DUF433 family)